METTHAKAKEVMRFAEKMITRAKAGDMQARRMVSKDLKSKTVMIKLFDVIAPRVQKDHRADTRNLSAKVHGFQMEPVKWGSLTFKNMVIELS